MHPKDSLAEEVELKSQAPFCCYQSDFEYQDVDVDSIGAVDDCHCSQYVTIEDLFQPPMHDGKDQASFCLAVLMGNDGA